MLLGDSPAIIWLMGPTAAGKTALAFELADRLPCEIISVDSAMIYRGMDIGTAKPSLSEREAVPHHLVDILDPTEAYSAAQFVQDACRLIDQILERGKVPLLVGGTMLYFHALQHGLAVLPPANPAIRLQIETDAQKRGWHALHEELAKIDPVSARRIHPNDSQRVQRALEVYYLTEQPLSVLQKAVVPPLQHYRVQRVAIAPPTRAQLHEKIALRFASMLEHGFIEEVEALYQDPRLHLNLPALRAVGYRQVWRYLDGTYGYEMMQEKAIVATRQLAKRQLTWLRSWEDVYWLEMGHEYLVENKVLRFFSKQCRLEDSITKPE